MRGMIASWGDHCPVNGKCSECGLDFEWVDVLRPERIAPRWSVEHVTRWRLPLAVPRTLWRCFAPTRLWSQLRLETPLRWRRLIVMAILLLLTTHAVAAGANIWMNWNRCQMIRVVAGPRVQSVNWAQVAHFAMQPYARLEVMNAVALRGWTLLIMLWGILAPVPYVLLVDTMRQSKVRAGHLWRGWVYFLPMIVSFAAVGAGVGRLLWGQLFIDPGSRSIMIIGTVLGGVAIWWWWSRFARFYLRLKEPILVCNVMLFIALLAAASAGLLLSWDLRVFVGSLIS